MKKSILNLAFLLITFGCQRHYQYPLVLQEADSLCVVQPDSAISLLKSISTEMLQAPAYVQKRHQLLTIKANDKAYITHTSDSLILSLVDYYEHGGDNDFLGEAYYYAGSTYRDLGDAPRALDYYQKALDAMPGNENLKVKSKVYAQMGNLFRKQYLYEQAIKSFQQSYQCDFIRKDTLGMIYNLRDIGFAYRGLDKPDSTLLLLNKAYELAIIKNSKRMMNDIAAQMASLYIRLGDYDKAKSLILPSLNDTERSYLSTFYSIAANMYFQISQFDSATYYYTQLLKKGTIYARSTANKRLAHIALYRWHDSEKALAYLEQYALLQDSINSITATESVSQTNALYNYNLREKENSQLLLKQKNYQLLFTTGIIILLTMILGISFYVFRNRHKRQLLQSELQKELAKNYYFEDYIAQREAIIEQMESKANSVGSENQELREVIVHQRQLLDDYMRSAKQTQQLASLIPGDIKASPTYEMINDLIYNAKSIKDNEIAMVFDMMKTYFPSFVNHLLLLPKLSLQEQLICIFTKLDISNKDIANLVVKSESTISSARIRIYEKLAKSKGTAKDFNHLISSL